jgi:hypothetical protein
MVWSVRGVFSGKAGWRKGDMLWEQHAPRSMAAEMAMFETPEAGVNESSRIIRSAACAPIAKMSAIISMPEAGWRS